MADITKEALEYIANDLADPYITEVEGVEYADKKMFRIHTDPTVETLTVHSLDAFVDYITHYLDADIRQKINFLVHVISPTRVQLITPTRPDTGKRDVILDASPRSRKGFVFDRYYPQEEFLIALRTNFIPNEDLSAILRFAGTVETGTVAEYGDDGISQKATIRKGVASKTDAIVPGIVKLRPFRTFKEIEQPESEFIFRMAERDGEVLCAIFEADGGAWEEAAVGSLQTAIRNELETWDIIYLPVIA